MYIYKITIITFIISMFFTFYKLFTEYFATFWKKILGEKILFNKNVELPRITILSMLILLLIILLYDLNQSIDKLGLQFQISSTAQSITIILICLISFAIWSSKFDSILMKSDRDYLKFDFKDLDSIQKFRNICIFFNDKYSLFNSSTDELMDLIDPNTKKGTIFNINMNDKIQDWLKQDLFYLFIEITKKTCLKNNNIWNVVESRFRFNNAVLKKETITKQKSRSLNNLSIKDKTKIKEELMHYQVKW